MAASNFNAGAASQAPPAAEETARSSHDDPLLGCLLVLAKLLDRPATADGMTAGLPLVDERLTPELAVRAAARAGLSAKLVRRPLDKISNLVLPAILILKDGQACVLETRQEDGTLRVVQPESGEGQAAIPAARLAELYTGFALFVRPAYRFDSRTSDTVIPRTGHWFWGTMSASWPIYGEVILASFLINVFAVAMPLFIMNVYDRVVPNNAVETLWVLAIGVTVIFGFDLLMRSLRGYFIDVAGRRADIVLSATLFERVLGIRMEARPQSVGAFANNLHEFDTFRDFFTSATLTSIIDLPFVLLFILVIFWIGGEMALIPLTVVPLALIAGILIQGPLGRNVQELMRHGSQKNATLIESLTGLETIKTMGAEGAVQRRWEQAIGYIARLGLKVRFLSASAVNVATFLQQLATAGIVIWGVYKIADGELTVGGLIACVILNTRALAPVAQVASTLTRWQQARVSLRTINQLMDAPVERPEDKSFLHRPRFRGAIEFKDVHFRYPGQEIDALHGLSFKIARGERVAIIGRVGSGKSTVAKLILGLYEPGAGSILVDGTDLRQLDPADIRRNLGYVPQDITLFFGSVKDNIRMRAPYADDTAILKAAEIAGVTEFTNRQPAGFDLQVGERGETLSGGQRQSIAIARALLLDPPILSLDEPSNNMDNRTEEQFKGRLASVLGDRTLVLVTHRASLLELVDRIIVVDAGHVVADGPKQSVLEALKQGQIKVTKE